MAERETAILVKLSSCFYYLYLNNLRSNYPALYPATGPAQLIRPLMIGTAVRATGSATSDATLEIPHFRRSLPKTRDKSVRSPRKQGTAAPIVQLDRARYADLVILGQYEWQGHQVAHPLPIAQSVVSRCGRPVLVVPAANEPTSFDRAAIASDGSREAVRNVHDALPLLALQ